MNEILARFCDIHLSNIDIIAFHGLLLILALEFAQIVVFVTWFYCHPVRYSGCANDRGTLSYENRLVWVWRTCDEIAQTSKNYNLTLSHFFLVLQAIG